MLWPIINIIQVILLALWCLLCSLLFALAGVITFNERVSVYLARTIWSPVFAWICLARTKVSGYENLDKNIPYVFISNHQSYLDVPLLFMALKRNIYFTPKAELGKIPLVGWYLKTAGMIFIDRKNPEVALQSIKQAAQKVKQGKSVLFFPEGTRTKTGELGTFKKGGFTLAIEAGVGVLPIYIDGARKVLPVNNFRIRPGKIDVKIGSPIITTSFENANKLKDYSREEILKLKGAGQDLQS